LPAALETISEYAALRLADAGEARPGRGLIRYFRILQPSHIHK